MTVNAEAIAQLRRMIAEPTTATYTDAMLEAIILQYPVMDSFGEEPFDIDYTTEPITATENDDWIDTFDLHRAAADIWHEKAAAIACDYDVSGDGVALRRTQAYENYMRQSRFHSSKRKPAIIKTYRVPDESNILTLQKGTYDE